MMLVFDRQHQRVLRSFALGVNNLEPTLDGGKCGSELSRSCRGEPTLYFHQVYSEKYVNIGGSKLRWRSPLQVPAEEGVPSLFTSTQVSEPTYSLTSLRVNHLVFDVNRARHSSPSRIIVNCFFPRDDTKLLWDGNRKPYAGYRMVSLSMTLSDPWPGFQGHGSFKRQVSPKRRILQT